MARPRTHEGGLAHNITAKQQLERSVMSCLLFEDTFYEDGKSIADRITEHAHNCSASDVADIAIRARTQMKLRHVPLWLACALASHSNVPNRRIISDTVANIVQRPDELTELLAQYWRDGRKAIPNQFKLGLARAFTKFDEYQLAKYNRDTAIKLRDVLFLVHPKAKDDLQQEVWNRLVEGTLKTPNTWETRLSAGEDKKATFEDLLNENKLGYMALLRNLRNMKDAGIRKSFVEEHLIKGAKNSKALPFRFIAAAQACPEWEDIIDEGLVETVKNLPRLPGRTAIAVDCSGSMGQHVSGKSQMTCFDAAAALAMIVAGTADEFVPFAYGSETRKVAPRQGMALRDALRNANTGYWTRLDECVRTIHNDGHYDRIIVITDEQTAGKVPAPVDQTGYLINVASYQNGVGYGPWVHIDGMSEATVQFILELEKSHVE